MADEKTTSSTKPAPAPVKTLPKATRDMVAGRRGTYQTR